MKQTILSLLLALSPLLSPAEDGHALWLRYKPCGKANIIAPQGGATLQTAVDELKRYWQGPELKLILNPRLKDDDGFLYNRDSICSHSELGLLYGAYEALRLQAQEAYPRLGGYTAPKFSRRILNHWDNLDGTIECGYAGKSIFFSANLKGQEWAERIREYARANASVGINGSVLNNVNASPKVLTTQYIDTVCTIANILRPYGIKVYLSVNFGSPKALGYTKTADPLDETVKKWWKKKADEIYQRIPDFGGFLVKANAEGQPGPLDYGRTHAEGANMLADALAPHGGIVMWRSFVYGAKHKGEDRVMQAVSEFKDLDGLFKPNVILQSKNGPLDFQPREPYAPIFDNMKKTQQAVEFQITQEYTGQGKHLVFLAPMWKEFFSFVAPDSLKAIAGVSNIGDDINWCGHPFSQANWYAFGRLAWNPSFSSDFIAQEWIGQTFGNEVNSYILADMMTTSREACVDYMMPLGLHHLFASQHHYGPEADGVKVEYPLEWCPIPYHKAAADGIGFDRSSKGTNAVSQYREPYRSLYDNLATCPDEYLLWFHHVPWDYRLHNGDMLWDELCALYYRGIEQVVSYQKLWNKLRPQIDQERWEHVNRLLALQLENAKECRDYVLRYFQQFSKMPLKYNFTGVSYMPVQPAQLNHKQP
ncbi:alpha-glucuronidase [Prevotella sp. HMSC069G02]|nr:alpha-glucuronidase [Prevotella sp. HMSC069G02]